MRNVQHIRKSFTTLQTDFMRVELLNFPSGKHQNTERKKKKKTRKQRKSAAKSKVQLLFFQKRDLVYCEIRDPQVTATAATAAAATAAATAAEEFFHHHQPQSHHAQGSNIPFGFPLTPII